MKNIFKFMGVALIACSLIMVSCKKDDENSSNDSTPVTPGPGPQPQQGSYTLQLDNESINWGYVDAKAYESEGTWAMASFQAAVSMTSESANFPYFVTVFYAGNTQSGTAVMALCDFFENASYATELYYETALQASSGYMGDYQLDDITNYDFGTFDATAHTLTCNYSLVFYDYMGWQHALEAACAAHDMTLEDYRALSSNDPIRQQIYNEADAETDKKNVEFALNNYPFVLQ